MAHELSEQDYRMFVRLSDFAARFGGPDGLAKKVDELEADNAKYRNKAKEAEAKVPAEGSRVLTKEQAEVWAKVEAKAKDAAAVDALLAAADKTAELTAEIAKRDKAEKRRKAAEAEGMDEAALLSLAGADALDYDTEEVADPKDATKKVPAGFVTVDGKKVRLGEHARVTWPKVAESLFVKQGASGGATGGTGGIPFAPERPAGGGNGKLTQDDKLRAVEKTADYTGL